MIASREVPVNMSMACWPGLTFSRAAEEIAKDAFEPLWGDLRRDHIQICPQNAGVFDEQVYDTVRRLLPNSRFRLHANVRVRSQIARSAASAFNDHTRPYFEKLASLSKMIDAPAYSLHAGRRAECQGLAQLAENVRALEDLFDCPVAVEGHYPEGKNMWLISSWTEYAWLLASGLKYALDLSHLNIVARRSRSTERQLVNELLGSDKCIEVHVSGNDGVRDRHDVLDTAQWWSLSLKNTNPNAVFFTEGNHKR